MKSTSASRSSSAFAEGRRSRESTSGRATMPAVLTSWFICCLQWGDGSAEPLAGDRLGVRRERVGNVRCLGGGHEPASGCDGVVAEVGGAPLLAERGERLHHVVGARGED